LVSATYIILAIGNKEGSKIKILVVDDSDHVRREVSNILTGEGHEVVEGKDGSDGFAKAKNNLDVSLLITDFNMPEMDGLTMITKIRDEIPEYAKVPIVMLTTEGSKSLKVRGKQAGVLLWIVKPVSPKGLVNTLKKMEEKYIPKSG